MQIVAWVVPALLLVGCAGWKESPPGPANPQEKAPAVEYRSAFDGYQPFGESEPVDWRRANEQVGAAGGHAGHEAGQGAGQKTSKPQPGKAESSGGPAEHGGHHR